LSGVVLWNIINLLMNWQSPENPGYSGAADYGTSAGEKVRKKEDNGRETCEKCE
jgi:hypothetical protein